MIKLADILREMAMSPFPKENYDVVIEAARAMGESNPVLWRGIRGGKSIVTHVVGDREHFRGGNEGAKMIMQKLGIKHPVFCYFERPLVKLFGTPCVVIPNKSYKMYQSKLVKDVMTFASSWKTTYTNVGGGTSSSSVFRSKDEVMKAVEDGAASYEELIDGKPLYESREVIVDVEDYWAIPVGAIDEFLEVGKMPKTKPPKEYSTYGDVIQALTFLQEYFQLNPPQQK